MSNALSWFSFHFGWRVQKTSKIYKGLNLKVFNNISVLVAMTKITIKTVFQFELWMETEESTTESFIP